MRLPFFDPHRDEVAATATDLITRFGLRAHDEASHLAQLSAEMHSRRHRVLYELAAREIDASFVEAQKHWAFVEAHRVQRAWRTSTRRT